MVEGGREAVAKAISTTELLVWLCKSKIQTRPYGYFNIGSILRSFMAEQKTPFERDDEGYLTLRGEIAMLRDIRDYAKIGSQQRNDLSALIGRLLHLLGEEE
jgi:hypothetical protein